MTERNIETLEQRLVREAAEERARREAEEQKRLSVLLEAFRS